MHIKTFMDHSLKVAVRKKPKHVAIMIFKLSFNCICIRKVVLDCKIYSFY